MKKQLKSIVVIFLLAGMMASLTMYGLSPHERIFIIIPDNLPH